MVTNSVAAIEDAATFPMYQRPLVVLLKTGMDMAQQAGSRMLMDLFVDSSPLELATLMLGACLIFWVVCL